MTKFKLFSLLAAAALMPASLLAQMASIHGHVNNAAGFSVPGQVGITADRTTPGKTTKFVATLTVGENGDYKGDNIPPGSYYAYFMQTPGNFNDRMDITLKKDEDLAVNFDMTRKEFLEKMTPEERANLEAYKANAAKAMAANAGIKAANDAIRKVHDDLASANPNYDDDVKTMKDAVAAKGDEAVVWYNLGAAQIASADAKVKAAKAAHQAYQSDTTITGLYQEGVDSYKKGIDLNTSAKKPNPGDAGIAYNAIGNAEAKMGKIPEAQDAFENAVKLAPTTAGLVYSNEAAVLLNANNSDAAATAADKSIAADPTRADAYYIKGQALVGKATVDAAGKIVAPPGCIEAYQKYLELSPDGSHAQDVKDVLTGMGQSITTSYKAPGAKPSKNAVKVK